MGAGARAGSRFFVKKIPLLVTKTNWRGGTEHCKGFQARCMLCFANPLQEFCFGERPACSLSLEVQRFRGVVKSPFEKESATRDLCQKK
jgi:hypothetical protein